MASGQQSNIFKMRMQPMKGKLGGGVDENVEGEPDKNGMSNIVLFLAPSPPPHFLSRSTVAATSHGLIARLMDFEGQLIVSLLCLQKCQMNVEIVKNIG